MLVGYGRVSTMDKNPALQLDALREAGCKRIYTETASGSHRNRPQIEAALDWTTSEKETRSSAGSLPDTGVQDRLGQPRVL
jgi:DNA invertase Pin-like site-specific DNA recombinase